MKDFGDFLTNDIATELSKIATASAIKNLSETEIFPESKRVAIATSKTSTQVSIELLRRYHEWLSQNQP